MKSTMKKVLSILLSVAGTVLSVYIAGYWLFARPLYFLISALGDGSLTRHLLIVCVVKIFFASTVGGGIWCIFDIIAGFFREYPYDNED